MREGTTQSSVYASSPKAILTADQPKSTSKTKTRTPWTLQNQHSISIKLLPSYFADRESHNRRSTLRNTQFDHKRDNAVAERLTFHTLPTPAIEKYHMSNQFIHSFPKYFIRAYIPKSATEPACNYFSVSITCIVRGTYYREEPCVTRRKPI